jgi:hydroxyquinol 1,2-dioxygenase
MRPARVHFMVEAAGFQNLVTHLFVEGDPVLDAEVVFGVSARWSPPSSAASRAPRPTAEC